MNQLDRIEYVSRKTSVNNFVNFALLISFVLMVFSISITLKIVLLAGTVPISKIHFLIITNKIIILVGILIYVFATIYLFLCHKKINKEFKERYEYNER